MKSGILIFKFTSVGSLAVSLALVCRPEFGNDLWISAFGMEKHCPMKVKWFPRWVHSKSQHMLWEHVHWTQLIKNRKQFNRKCGDPCQNHSVTLYAPLWSAHSSPCQEIPFEAWFRENFQPYLPLLKYSPLVSFLICFILAAPSIEISHHHLLHHIPPSIGWVWMVGSFISYKKILDT